MKRRARSTNNRIGILAYCLCRRSAHCRLYFQVSESLHGWYILLFGLLGWVIWNILLLARFKTLRTSERFYTFGRLAMAAAVFVGIFMAACSPFIVFLVWQ